MPLKNYTASSKSINNNIVYTFRNDEENKNVYMVALRDENGTLIGYYEKHEYRNKETQMSIKRIPNYLDNDKEQGLTEIHLICIAESKENDSTRKFQKTVDKAAYP